MSPANINADAADSKDETRFSQREAEEFEVGRAEEEQDPFLTSYNGKGGNSSRKENSMAASWQGTPSIKGSSESMRMALLTFSLVGLQYVFFYWE